MEKIQLAEDLYNTIDKPTEFLDEEIAKNYPELSENEGPVRKRKNSKRNKQENGNYLLNLEWEYEAC